ncbi:thioredoxin family protein [Hoyosella rhizosphaerae]|nr:thioredoxin family protein [Hoyosella rhizosphaerae]
MWWQRHHGSAIATNGQTEHHEGLADVGVSAGSPTVVHFTADWCGPCAAVRRVIQDTLPDFPGVSHVELDINEHPELSRDLGILSLPTTLVYDSAVQQRFRIPGVPTRETLSDALISAFGQQS